MKISIDEFKEQYLPALQEEFHQKTMEAIIREIEDVKKKMREQMNIFIKLAVAVQKQIPVEIGMIQVALLNTSLYLEKPQIAFTAYGKDGYFGEELLTMKRDAKWLFEAWEEYKTSISKEVENLHAEVCIRSEGVRQMAWESIPYLQTCLYAVTKYEFRDVDQFEQYDELLKAPGFSIRVGAYMDWGKVVHQEEEETDIFFDAMKRNFRFCRFRQVVYSHKVFKDMDLRAVKFTECEFVQCEFENVNLNDAWFQKCRIYHCTFKNVKLLGLTLEQTTMKKTHFEDCVTKVDVNSPSPEDMEEAYKPMMAIECIIDEDSRI